MDSNPSPIPPPSSPPDQSPEAVQPADTRIAIREAAKRLFLRQGYHQVSMRALAAEAGISTGPLYFHYRSKSDVFFDICMDALSRLNDQVEQAAATGPDFLFRLREIFRAFQHFYELEPLNSQLVRLCFNPLFGIGFSREQLELLQKKKALHMGLMQDVIRQGIACGELKELDSARFMLILYALGDGIFSARENGDLERLGITLEALMEEASRLLYTGIVKRQRNRS